mgnify:CR=1 FL=1
MALSTAVLNARGGALVPSVFSPESDRQSPTADDTAGVVTG